MKSKITCGIAVALVIAISGCAQQKQRILGQVVISEDSTRLVFYDAEAAKMTSTFYKQTLHYGAVSYIGVWIRPGALFPQARIQYIELGPNYHYPDEYYPHQYIKELNFGDKAIPKALTKSSAENILGYIRYQRFVAGTAPCVAFSQTWVRSFIEDHGTEGNARLVGHYCSAPGKNLSDSRVTVILNNFGVKGEGVPVPSEAWQNARKSSPSEETMEISAKFDWPVFGNDVSAKFLMTSRRNGGKIWVSPGKDIECSGKWNFASGGQDTSGKQQGKWSILCNNGMIASGSFATNASKTVTGSGDDGDGNPITFTFLVPG